VSSPDGHHSCGRELVAQLNMDVGSSFAAVADDPRRRHPFEARPDRHRPANATFILPEGGYLDEGLRQRRQFTKRLSNAIERHEISLHYQPQYRSDDGRHCGVEALARWCSPQGHAISPVVFVRHAEQTGLISALGQWVLELACETAASWRVAGEVPPILCVNVSPYQIGPEFSTILARTLKRTGFPASCLELEITEGTLIKNTELALECLSQWKELGVRIALDDFGTGYSNLSYLSRLPVDRLKIDRSLIQRVVRDSKTAAIVRALISLGDDLGFEVLAEGVETEAQFEVLVRMGCQQMQGYLLTPPVCDHEAKLLLTQNWGARHAATRVMPDTARLSAHAS
jgi:EAL domain-containing protein (putative c-di-GMP-specific phosphodiesterase class I)